MSVKSCGLHDFLLNKPCCRKLLKNTSIVPKAWSISQTEKGNFKNEVSAVLCVYNKAKLCVVMNSICWKAHMVICDDWSKSWVLAASGLALTATSRLGLGFVGWLRQRAFTAARLVPATTSRLRLLTLRYWGLLLQWIWPSL